MCRAEIFTLSYKKYRIKKNDNSITTLFLERPDNNDF